jgi:hypothetical protein
MNRVYATNKKEASKKQRGRYYLTSFLFLREKEERRITIN